MQQAWSRETKGPEKDSVITTKKQERKKKIFECIQRNSKCPLFTRWRITQLQEHVGTGHFRSAIVYISTQYKLQKCISSLAGREAMPLLLSTYTHGIRELGSNSPPKLVSGCGKNTVCLFIFLEPNTVLSLILTSIYLAPFLKCALWKCFRKTALSSSRQSEPRLRGADGQKGALKGNS